jgi:alpha-D-ribose 1-methylphosphonate 5-triphosphate synthase subunit PhnG
MNAQASSADPTLPARRAWLGVLARIPRAALEQGLRAALPDATETLAQLPRYVWLRAPETGLAMVRGRAGGSGDPFNLGEATVTRATLRLEATPELPAAVGIAYQLGRDKRRAELAALCDALLQTERHRDAIEREVIAPAMRARQAERERERTAAEATRVEFFTMVRGE